MSLLTKILTGAIRGMRAHTSKHAQGRLKKGTKPRSAWTRMSSPLFPPATGTNRDPRFVSHKRGAWSNKTAADNGGLVD